MTRHMIKDELDIYGSKSALKLSLITSLIFVFIMVVTHLFAKWNDIDKGRGFFDFVTINTLIIFISNIIILYILFRCQFWIYLHIENKRKRSIVCILGPLLILFILSPLFTEILWRFNKLVPKEMMLIFLFVKDLILFFISLLLSALIHVWIINQKNMLENQMLVIKNLQNRYQALKNQVDPHFLFNSLNTLNGLIGYDDDKAHEYIDQLSSIFRYTMQNKQILHLEEELDFTKSYIHLMQIRYNNGLQVTYSIDEKYREYHILPMALQMLIENAVKHNVISNKYPLSITIETTPDHSIRIQNSIRLKNNGETSGIGLSNLNERYHMIFNKEIRISQDDTLFTVEIPLINDLKKYNKSLYIA